MTIITEVLCCGSPFAGCAARRPNTRNDCLRNEELSYGRISYLPHRANADSTMASLTRSDESGSETDGPESCFGRLTAFVGRSDNMSPVRSDSKNRYMSCIAIAVPTHLNPS